MKLLAFWYSHQPPFVLWLNMQNIQPDSFTLVKCITSMDATFV